MTYDDMVSFIRLQEKKKKRYLKVFFVFFFFFASMTTNLEKIFICNLGNFFFLLQNCCVHTQLKSSINYLYSLDVMSMIVSSDFC